VRKIELLSPSHDREGFDCGSDPLNLFLKQTARQHADRGISRTFVLVEEDAVEPKPIVGFFSLNLCQIKSEVLPPEAAKKLPRDVSGVRLGRLARAKEFRGQGVGEILLAAALHKFMEIYRRAGGIGLFVDAKDQSAKEFYLRFGFAPLPSSEMQLFLPVKTIEVAVRNG
jgi:ribosomal protein S18 acetylase RimI-like enzyme